MPPPDRMATGRKTCSSVVNAMPAAVRTTVPDGMVYADVGSQLVQRTPPVAAVRWTRLPVAWKSPWASTGMVRVSAGTTPDAASTLVAFGSARTVKFTGPTASTLGVTVMEACGSRR